MVIPDNQLAIWSTIANGGGGRGLVGKSPHEPGGLEGRRPPKKIEFCSNLDEKKFAYVSGDSKKMKKKIVKKKKIC